MVLKLYNFERNGLLLSYLDL